MIIYELWVCKEPGNFELHSQYIGRGAAELMRIALEQKGIYENVWIEEKYEPEED